MSPGRMGPNPNSGSVGPNTATVGVPIAVATCNGALSFVTKTRARAISAADCRNVSFPHALTAPTIASPNPTSSAPPTTTTGITPTNRRANSG